MKKIEQKDLFELKNVAQPVVAGGDIFFTETKMNEKKNTYESGLVLSVMKEKIKLLN